MIRGVIVFALLGVALASPSANQYIENVLQTSLPNELRALYLEPASLPAFTVPVGYHGIYQQAAQANFFNGNVTGLTLLRRRTECQGPRLAYGEITINCTIGIYPTTYYNLRLVNGSNVHNVRSMGFVEETLVDVVFAGRPQNYVGSVKQFQIQKLGLVKPGFTGIPQTFSKYENVLKDAYRANVSANLINVLQHGFVTALARAVAYKPMPRQ